MKVFAVGNNNECVEMIFASEEDADKAFNEVINKKLAVGKIVDASGKSEMVNVYHGYSRNKSEIVCLLNRR